MQVIYNGMPASGLPEAAWAASRHGDAQAACAELAALPEGSIALRNSHDPDGPALIYTHAEIEAFIAGAKDGEFDNLIV
ncbi:MAG TPA: DUF397 domain-containing protein [Streptosporangiaceae bacterium]|nr:DUF397 domain-containing protein [Streptosporangiaceae bacterium]